MGIKSMSGAEECLTEADIMAQITVEPVTVLEIIVHPDKKASTRIHYANKMTNFYSKEPFILVDMEQIVWKIEYACLMTAQLHCRLEVMLTLNLMGSPDGQEARDGEQIMGVITKTVLDMQRRLKYPFIARSTAQDNSCLCNCGACSCEQEEPEIEEDHGQGKSPYPRSTINVADPQGGVVVYRPEDLSKVMDILGHNYIACGGLIVISDPEKLQMVLAALNHQV